MRAPAGLQDLLKRSGVVIGALLLAACGAPRQEPPDAAAGKAFKVVTTFLPITLFTRAVAGDCATVTPLIPASTGPHDFQAKPGDLMALRQARVLVKNGLEMESFLGKLIASAGNPQLQVIDSSRGVATLDTEHQDDGHGHDHGAVNPHIWLDPLRAVQQVETIRDGLVAADPGCAAGYRQRAAAYVAELRRLDAEIAATLKPFRGRTFVVFHDFAPYFADRYGLKADFLVETPEQAPSPADVQRVVNAVRDSQVTVLLRPPGERPGIFETLSNDLGIKMADFSPVETLSERELADPGTYLRLMRANASALRKAFAP